jgi:hypothetical protein
VKYILAILSIVIITVSCKKEKDCLNYSSNTGLIITEQDMGKCYGAMQEDSYLIKDTTEYKELSTSIIESIQAELGCGDDPARDTIDFDKYYLIGAKTLAKGCIVTYSRDISFIEESKLLQYDIDVHQCGDCTDERYNMNWVLINKIDEIDTLNVSINYYIESN